MVILVVSLSLLCPCSFCFSDADMWEILSGPSTCTKYVAENPDAFVNAFWEFGDFKVFSAA